MRYRALVVLVGLVGCSSGLLEATSQPPSGLPVTVTSNVASSVVSPTTGTITGKGDSIVAVVTRPSTCGRSVSALAGEAGTSVVITILLTAQGVQNCDPVPGMTTYRAVATRVSGGLHDASVRIRLVTNGAVSDTTIVRTNIVLP